jgi:hypothetical protein
MHPCPIRISPAQPGNKVAFEEPPIPTYLAAGNERLRRIAAHGVRVHAEKIRRLLQRQKWQIGHGTRRPAAS